MKKTFKIALALGLVTIATAAIALVVEELREDTLEDFEPALDKDDDGIDGDCLADEEDDPEDCYYTKGEAVTPADSEDNSTSTGEED